MVSVFMYNKVGKCESFKGFVREWHAAYKALEQKQAAGKTASPLEEWDAYCHLLPQHHFTHDENGKQLVRYVIRQEESKTLKTDSPASSVQNISPALKKTLLEMP